MDLLNFTLEEAAPSQGGATGGDMSSDLLGGFVDFTPTPAPAPTPSNDFFDPFGSSQSGPESSENPFSTTQGNQGHMHFTD